MGVLSRLRALLRPRSASVEEPAPVSVTAALRDHEGLLRASRTKPVAPARGELSGWIDGEQLAVSPKPKPLVLVGLRGMRPYLMSEKERKAHEEAVHAHA